MQTVWQASAEGCVQAVCRCGRLRMWSDSTLSRQRAQPGCSCDRTSIGTGRRAEQNIVARLCAGRCRYPQVYPCTLAQCIVLMCMHQSVLLMQVGMKSAPLYVDGRVHDAGATAAAAGVWAWQRQQQHKAEAAGLPAAEEGAHLVNWSATREVRPRRLYQPETQAELEALVASHHKSGGAQGPIWSLCTQVHVALIAYTMGVSLL